MIMKRTPLAALVVLFLVAAMAPAQVIGTTVRGLEPDKLAGTKAQSLDDYAGRLLLLEFFAYW